MPTKALARSRVKLFPQTVVAELASIESDLGGRNALVGMLVLAPLTPDLRYVLGLLGDPKHKSRSLAELCAIGNILPGDLLKHLAAAARLRGDLKAAQKIGDGIAAVVEDVMRRAAPYEAPCNGGCQGTGSITEDPSLAEPNPSPQPCPVCKGGGKLTYLPDLARQELAIEMAHLLPKGGGIQIAQINGAAPGGGSAGMGTLEKLSQLTDKILYGESVEGEFTVEEPAEDSAQDPAAERPAVLPEAE